MKILNVALIVLVFAVTSAQVWAQAPAPAPAPAPAAPPPPPPPPPDPKTVSTKQVQIQVWIAETNEDGLRDLGANLDYTRFVRGVEQNGSVERITTNLINPRNTDYTVTLPAPDTNPAPDNLRPDQAGTLADGIQTQSGAGLTATVIAQRAGTIDAVFRSLERKSDADLTSKPEILVRDNQEAEIAAGGQVPYQSMTFDAVYMRQNLSVIWENVGVTVRLRPKVLSDTMVQVNLVRLEVNDIVQIEKSRGIDLPVFSKRSQTGIKLVPNGQTLVIGGLTSSFVRNTEQRVPIVGKVPVLGLPFRSRKAELTKSTLMVFLSPTIVDLRSLRPESNDALTFWRRENRDKWDSEKQVIKEIESLQSGAG